MSTIPAVRLSLISSSNGTQLQQPTRGCHVAPSPVSVCGCDSRESRTEQNFVTCTANSTSQSIVLKEIYRSTRNHNFEKVFIYLATFPRILQPLSYFKLMSISRTCRSSLDSRSLCSKTANKLSPLLEAHEYATWHLAVP